ncbi:tenascin-X isoform X2 [Seriola aureovittata]|uniref:tenascin-X isoform X2 n=1 Tax=Seriola aureovittata TaxID=2871759 RepID=UPI0024BE4F59|nr:tenascin-X isoform X2 [Seriola aureovittata]
MTISKLIAGVQYKINVTAVADDNHTDGQSTAVTQYTKPEVVCNLSVTNITTSSVYVMWTEPKGNRSFYRVHWSNGSTNRRDSVTETKLNITELTAGVNYSFTVIAVAGDNQTESEMAQIFHHTRPGIIGNHHIVSQNTSSISVNWASPPGEVFMYRLEWHNGGVLMTRYTNDTFAVLSELISGTNYTITVTAVAGDNETEGDPYTFTSFTRPELVRNLTVTNVTTSSVSVDWSEPEGNSSFYRVQWTDGQFNDTSYVSETSMTISKLIAGVQYKINVTAVADDNHTDGQSTAVTQYTKPEVVCNLSVTNITTSSVYVMWTEPKGNRSFYRVHWSNGSTNKRDSVTETKLNITELTAGVNYSFTVIAVAGDNQTESEMAQIFQHTRPGIIGNHHIVSQNTSSISVNWTSPPGEVFMYRLEWHNGGVLMTKYTNDTFAVLSELISGTNYTITVTAVAGDNETEGDPYTFTSFTRPELVRNLTVTNVTTSSVSVDWSEPEGNSSFYRVQWTDGQFNDTSYVSETSMTISNLTAGVQYKIIVTAVVDDNHTDGQSTAVTQYTKPEVVCNLSVTNITTSSVYVMWTEPKGNRSFYRVHWSNGSTNRRDSVTETKLNITELTAGVNYSFTVIAVAGDNQTESEMAQIFQHTRPGIIGNHHIVSQNTSSISVNWASPPGEVFMYRLEWHNGGVLMTRYTNDTFAVLSELISGTNYTITVTAVAGDNETEGDPYTFTSFTRPELVRNLTVTNVTTSSVSVDWSEPEGNSSFYRVQWTDGQFNDTSYVSETSMTISNLTAGVQYKINVTAVADDNHTDGQSTAVTQYTKPEVVCNLSVTNITTSSVYVMWTEPKGNRSFYRVHWSNGSTNRRDSVTETKLNITELTAGVNYSFTVIAMAGDNQTESEMAQIFQHTRPGIIGNHHIVSQNTSSISVNWTSPPGEVFMYRLEWHNGGVLMTKYTNDTFAVLSELISGTNYTITVTAVAGENETEGDPYTFTSFTRPELVRNLTVTNVTTSSVSVDWSEPEGNSSFYRVQWTDGQFNDTSYVSETSMTISNLTAGVQYKINVTAVADDNHTDGQSTAVTQYTRPGIIGNHHIVSQNTSSISVNWTSPPGEVFMYRLEWHNGGVLMTKYTNDTFAVLSELISGTNYTITVTAVAGDNETEGDPYTFTSVTRPELVRNLTVTNVTTSSVSVDWSEPEGNSSFYRVQWTDGQFNDTVDVSETSMTISNLTAGVQYEVIVTAVADDNHTDGQSTAVTQYTRPAKPGGITGQGTNSLSVSWTLPKGEVDHYVVTISNTILNYSITNITEATTANFTDLYPGRIYDIRVTAVAGNLNNTSDQASLATSPTPPGSIIISDRTNSSLLLKWAIPVLMEGAPDISYYITYHQSERSELQNKTSTVNSTELSLLFSGIRYNITVETVGPQNLRSTAVNYSTFTLPNPVLNIAAHPKSTTSIRVEWSYPLGAQSYYIYLITTYSTNASQTCLTSNNSKDIVGLKPGTRYNISVITRIEPGIESTEEQTFNYTLPKAVTNLTVSEVNTTAIRLTWVKQSDFKTSYSYLVIALQDAIEVQKNQTETETYTFFHLTPGELYTFYVFTVVEGVKSTRENTSSYTRPEAVSNIIAIGNTTTMSVSWTPAVGAVVSYTVLLYRDGQLVGNSTVLSNTTVTKVFQRLIPGVLYCVEVFTTSGSFESYSQRICNATLPNPPGPITVVSQTVKSINFTWSVPEGMDHNKYNFSVSTVNGSYLTENNWFLLDNLESGSPYNISVVTVGIYGYESTAVTAQNYTRPYSVTSLREEEITTNSVTLVWEQMQSKSHYSYEVQFTNGSFSSSKVVLNTTDKIIGLSSGSSYNFTVTTQTADGTRASPVTVSYYTRPHRIRLLKAETLNTTTVNLTWEVPLEDKSEYKYRIQTSGCGSQNKTIAENRAQISALTPGTECTFCVSVRAANGIEGEAECTSQYTKPETVQPSISSRGSNSSILVSWPKPSGKVEYYKVYLNGTSSAIEEKELNSTSTSFLFESLSAGRLYTARVISYSGPFNASSGSITNATFPNPPGSIEVLTKTTSSIEIRWEEAPLMTGASFVYKLTDTQSQGGRIFTTNTTSHTFASLLSGFSYNISIVTVGVMGFESERVHIYFVTTRPLSVESLVPRKAEENNITVTWKEPADYKGGYRYNLTWQGRDGPISNITSKTEYTIYNLDPGSLYSYNVTTETSDGTQSAPTSNSSCTKASPVKHLKCNGPDKENAQIVLSWTAPSGQHSGFLVTVNDSKISNSTNTCCNQTVYNLRHNTEYKLSVETLSCGEPSTPVSLKCHTGITAPNIPPNYESLLLVSETVYNRFSLQINRQLLSDTNGPITHLGVMVTNSPSELSGKDLKTYLGKTYDQWKAKDTPVYLATIRETSVQSRSGDNDLSIEVGDESKWNGYTNGPLDATGKYVYAIVLFTNLTTTDGFVNVEYSLVTVTNFYPTIQLPQNPAVIGIAVGVTLGIFFVLFIILIGFIIYWKRLSNKESSDIQIHSMRSVAVRVEDYEDYYKKQKADSNCGFAEEFEDLKLVGTGQSKTSALTMENKPKNRYNNVLPYDSSRVKLSIIHGSPYDDYINANYMPGYNSRKEFIAAQGPLPTTVNEFWRMIWEKNVQTLVMLTRCNEQGRVKCEQYWSSGTKHFENITVTTTSEIPLEDWTIRDFDIKNVKTAETRSVRHFHFTAWPDHGVPETTELLISFRHLVREHMDQYSRHSPTVVHCSAGVGRTGTFIAIDRLIFQIERENIVDVYGIVHDLRMHRPLMVQTEDQYVFLNQCAMDIIRSRTGTNVDLIYQNTAALSIYENVEPKKGFRKNGYHNA